MHSLVENYGDCGMDEEIEAVKREWWNVVTENSWEYLAGEKKEELFFNEYTVSDLQDEKF